MLRYNIKNLVTGERYEFTDEDLINETLEQRLEAKAKWYGQKAWTEVIPEWTDIAVDPPVLYPEQIIEHAATIEISITDISSKQQTDLLEAVYQAYEKAETANITAAGIVQLDKWCQSGLPRALDVAAWLQSLYAERDAKLTAIEAGDLTVDPKPSQPWKPWSFRDIPKA